MSDIVLTVVVDNNSTMEQAPGEHGLSLHIISNGKALLFDTGRSNLVMDNLKALGLDAIAPEWIALSHGHYDHTTGVAALLAKYPQAKLNFHPKLVEPKWILDNDSQWRYGGVPTSFYALPEDYRKPMRCCMELIPGVHSSGSILGDEAKSYQKGRFFRNAHGHKVIDAFPDEQVLIVISKNGLSIVSGCMHTGLSATLARAKVLFPELPFYALVGGLHLDGKSEEQLAEVWELLISHGFQKVMPLHCTGKGFVAFLENHAPEILVRGEVGSIIEL